MTRRNDIVFRCVGFKEVFDLLDLDRYDEILLEDMKATNERIEAWIIELYRVPDNKPMASHKTSDKPEPVFIDTPGNIGKSLGRMSVDDAKLKFL